MYIIYNLQTEAEEAFWVLYNDDPPNKGVIAKYGHAKGAVVTNKKLGFWLIHSVPNYPPMPNTGESNRRVYIFECFKQNEVSINEYSFYIFYKKFY